MIWKFLILLLSIIGIGLSIWFFFWPIVECIYALSWDPLYDPSHKIWLFFAGFAVLVLSSVGIIKGTLN